MLLRQVPFFLDIELLEQPPCYCQTLLHHRRERNGSFLAAEVPAAQRDYVFFGYSSVSVLVHGLERLRD